MKLSRKQKKHFFILTSIILTFGTFLLITGFFLKKEKQVGDEFSYLIKPFYQGFSKSGNKFEISSEKAVQFDEYEYSLNKVFFKYYQDKSYSAYFTVTSDSGLMDDNKKMFSFFDNVEMIQSSGYRGKTEKFFINFNEMRLYTDDQYTLTSAKIRLVSDKGLLYKPKEKKIFFHGPVKTVIIDQNL